MTGKERKKSDGGSLAALARIYKSVVLLLVVFLPIAGMSYLSQFVDANLKFDSYIVHEAAISIATVTLAFVSVVAYQCYKRAGEPFLRFLTLALIGFALIYAPHGILTRMAGHNLIAFLIFGPASRFVMSAYLLLALFHINHTADAPTIRRKPFRWWPHILLFIILDFILFALATSSLGLAGNHLRIIESLAFSFFLASALIVLLRIHTGSRFYVIAPLLFAQGSGAFLLARPWNHMWWFAHAIFAAGSLVLGYAIMRAYETAR